MATFPVFRRPIKETDPHVHCSVTGKEWHQCTDRCSKTDNIPKGHT